MTCPFCVGQADSRIILEDGLVFACLTNIPITPGHALVCPRRHLGEVKDLSADEWAALRSAAEKVKAGLRKTTGATGFNLAWNEGEAAGQTIDHLHLHIVPRQAGDAGVYGYEPRQFLYRPGSRALSPEAELADLAREIKANITL